MLCGSTAGGSIIACPVDPSALCRNFAPKVSLMRNSAALSLIIVLYFATGSIRGEDAKENQARWPQFRGPGGQGVGREGLRLPTQFGPGKKVVWKTALPAGHSSPCIWDDRIYLTGFDK